MEAVWDLYGPWLRLMMQIGLPLLVLCTSAMFLFERGSLLRRLVGQFALWGWSLVLLSVALRLIIRILQYTLATLPDMSELASSRLARALRSSARRLRCRPPLGRTSAALSRLAWAH